MNLENRKRKYGQGRTYIKNNKSFHLPISLDVMSLELICQYVLSTNRNIKRGMYINLRNMIELLDIGLYTSDQEKFKRIKFIKRALKGRLEDGISNPIMLRKYANGGLVDDDIIDTSSYSELSNQEIDWINQTVSGTLSLVFLYEEVDRAIDLFTRFKTAKGSDISKIGKEIKDLVSELNTKFRQVDVESVITESFSLVQNDMINSVDNVRSELTSEFRMLYTGMQGFNQLIGGGFENTRCYLFLGTAGIGKSLTLLNLAYQLKKYNKTFKAKDPTKIPTIVYLTMENTVTETVDRLFKIATGGDIRNFTTEEAVRMLKETGELYLTDESPVNLLIKYQPNRSVDTGYLYTLTEDLEDEGYEVICMIQDHVKRIRSASGQTEVRLELGDVINEMKTFAILKGIPMITVGHLNREAAKILDSTPSKSNKDITRLLGRSNTGESMLMIDNTDWSGILNVEYDMNDLKYLIGKCIKKRIGCRDYICQPFDEANEIKLIEDFNMSVPVFKSTLYEEEEFDRRPKTVPNTNVANSRYGNINTDSDNIFEIASRYSSVDIDSIEDNTSISYSDMEKSKEESSRKKKLFNDINKVA